MQRGVFALIGAAAACLFIGHAEAAMMLSFSDLASDETDSVDLSATVMFTISGDQLLIDITNDSEYQISQLYFNADSGLTGLDFSPSFPNWTITGAVASPEKVHTPFGSYDWLIDFGSGPTNRLGSGLTQLILDMTGTTSEATIGGTFSENPPGHTPALAVLKFEAGPGDDSAFAATLVPEPATAALILGCLTAGCLRRRQRP